MFDPLSSADHLSSDMVQRLVGELLDRWKVDAATRSRLLGDDLDRPDAGPATEVGHEHLDRARQLLRIHAGLRLLFPENQDIRWSWIHRRNQALEDRTPLALLLAGREGFVRVERQIRSELAT